MSLTKYRRRVPFFDGGVPAWFTTNEVFEDDFFNNGKNVPAMNVKENEKAYDIELAIPGFSKNEIEVSLENNTLQVSASRKKEMEENEEGYTRKEFSYDAFERKIQIPEDINQDNEVKATYNNGVLNLQLEKSQLKIENQKKKIKIK